MITTTKSIPERPTMSLLEELRAAYKSLNEADRAVAASLGQGFNKYGSWTPKQEALVERLIEKASKPSGASAQVDLQKIHELFDLAQTNGKKYPFVVLECDGVQIKLNRAGDKSATPGAINVATKEGGYANGVYYGRILPDGEWKPGRERLDGLLPLLQRFAADPQGMATLYGTATGVCCFCAKELDDPVSVKVGYGPKCAKVHGLPHSPKLLKA